MKTIFCRAQVALQKLSNNNRSQRLLCYGPHSTALAFPCRVSRLGIPPFRGLARPEASRSWYFVLCFKPNHSPWESKSRPSAVVATQELPLWHWRHWLRESHNRATLHRKANELGLDIGTFVFVATIFNGIPTTAELDAHPASVTFGLGRHIRLANTWFLAVVGCTARWPSQLFDSLSCTVME